MWTCIVNLAMVDGVVVVLLFQAGDAHLFTAATGRCVQCFAVSSAFSRSQRSIEESAPPDSILAIQISFTELG